MSGRRRNCKPRSGSIRGNSGCPRWAISSRLAEEAVKEKQWHVAYLEALLGAEVEERDHQAMARRIQEARFPAVKTLEEFDFQVVPQISVAVMRNLSEGEYLTRKEPVIFLGETDPATFCTSLLHS